MRYCFSCGVEDLKVLVEEGKIIDSDVDKFNVEGTDWLDESGESGVAGVQTEGTVDYSDS